MSTAIAAPTHYTSLQIKNILLTVDLSACSNAALLCAQAIARRFESTVHIVHIVGPEPHIGLLGFPYTKTPGQASAAKEAIEKLLRSGPLKGVPCTFTTQRGAVWEVLSKLCADLKIDLIVLGTHDHAGLKRLVLGSVATKILRSAARPVLTVGPEARGGLSNGRLNTIVCAIDFSRASQHALNYAASVARPSRSKLILVNAVHPLVVGEGGIIMVHMDDLTEKNKQRLANLMDDAETNYEVIAKYAPAADLILQIAADKDADLIVMGAHRRTLPDSPWSIAHRVVCHAICPVLAVRD